MTNKRPAKTGKPVGKKSEGPQAPFRIEVVPGSGTFFVDKNGNRFYLQTICALLNAKQKKGDAR